MMEFYDNTWTATSGYYEAGLVRGGTFMSFNNVSNMAGGDSWMEWLDMGTQDPQSFISTTNPSNYQIAISTVTASAGVFTVTTAVPHGLTVGKTILTLRYRVRRATRRLRRTARGRRFTRL